MSGRPPAETVGEGIEDIETFTGWRGCHRTVNRAVGHRDPSRRSGAIRTYLLGGPAMVFEVYQQSKSNGVKVDLYQYNGDQIQRWYC